MPDSLTFTVDVFRTLCDRLRSKAADLRLLVENGYSFEEWLNWEAFLACKHCEASFPFCEVTPKPSYASEGVAGEGVLDAGDLLVGGPNDGADHCWLFAEMVLLTDANRNTKWREKIGTDADKLLRLGWKKSAALLVVVSVSLGDVPGGGVEAAVGDRPPLTEPFAFALPGGGSGVVSAFDIKQNPADTLSAYDQ